MLSAEVFADLVGPYYQEEMAAAFPSVVKSREIRQVTLDDGSVRYDIVDTVGPPEVDLVKMRPMFLAMGRAIVEFLTGHAEVPITISNVSTGVETRSDTGRIL
jgi:hypothetical protein